MTMFVALLSAFVRLHATRDSKAKIAIRDRLNAILSELPASITESTKKEIARRIILTSFRDSSTPVMRMLMTMLLMLMIPQLYCDSVAPLYRSSYCRPDSSDNRQAA